MTAEPCPTWCGADHSSGDGSTHRGVIGSTLVGEKLVTVVILQTPTGPPTVAISGPMYVGIDDLDHDSMAELLTMCGQPKLAALVRKAAAVRAAELLRGVDR